MTWSSSGRKCLWHWGWSMRLQAEGIRAFGPCQPRRRASSPPRRSARTLCVVTASAPPSTPFWHFTSHDEALAYLNSHPAPIVVKASGLAAGKGAIVCHTDIEAQQAVDRIMVAARVWRRRRRGGHRGLYERPRGLGVGLCRRQDGQAHDPLAQDHKPAYDGDEGPNTGGMGTYAPAPVLDDATLLARRKAMRYYNPWSTAWPPMVLPMSACSMPA